MKVRALLFVALACPLAATGCDRFEGNEPDAGSTSADPRARAREQLTTVMKAAAVVTRTCTAGDLSWEEEATEEAGPKHYSRPCIPERCSPEAPDVEALRESTFQAKQLVSRDPTLQIPSIQGVVSLADAMVRFIDTSVDAAKSDPKGQVASLSGLSMHYGSLAGAFVRLYDEPKFPVEPPSLSASLLADGVGGDVCKGWGNPKYCDVAAITVPKVHRWRASPACVEVDSVKKPK